MAATIAQHSTAQHSLDYSLKHKPKVVITNAVRWSYFEWFLLGLYKLRDAGEIDLEINLSITNKFLSAITIRGIDRIRRRILGDGYNMDGYIIFGDGTKRTFTIDSADSPFLFDYDKLRSVDTYFKMQCPIDLSKDYFELAENIHVPWSDHKHADTSLKLTERGERIIIKNFGDYTHKIKPLLNAVRRLSDGILYYQLNGRYKKYISDRKTAKSKRFMCYFGNPKGPVPSQNIFKPDYDSERDLMGHFSSEVSHPNEKRAKIAEYLTQFGDEADARIICKSNSDVGLKLKVGRNMIPLGQFCEFISNFQYNFNVSGYRLSIPSRFIESFIVGTAIVTDKLSVKWYLPFDPCEVVETVRMGYERMDKVDWAQFERDVQNLPDIDPAKIIECYNRKWSPEVVARYIIDTVRLQEGENSR